MKMCQVQSRPDRGIGKHVPCGELAEFKANYKPIGGNNPDYYQYPTHTTYMCSKHAEMATKLVKVDRKID